MSTSDTQRLTGLPLGIATMAVALASFMNILDTTIAVVALPSIAGNLGATTSQSSWVITLYSVCLAVVLPLSGWITRRFGEVRTFCVALMLFSLTSWLCAIASSFNELLVYRALQGCSGGLLLPLSQSLLMRIYPPEKHGFALGIWGVTSTVAPILGPMLGGYITDEFGWPWIFLINLPIGAIATYACWVLLRDHESEIHKEPVDLPGLILLAVGVICFQLMLDRGHELDWLASRQIQLMLAISLLCFVVFIVWERRQKYPVVDLSLLGYRTFVLGSLLISVLYISIVLTSLLFPLWLQTVQGYTATAAGLVMAPFGVGPILLMPLIGQRLHQWDARPTVTVGIIVFCIAYYLHAHVSTDVTGGYIGMARFIMGLAMPFAWMPLMMLVLSGLPKEKMASASGLFNFIRMLASSMGTALGITLWDERSVFHHSRLVESLSEDSPAYISTQAMLTQALPDQQGVMAVFDVLITQQARTLGLNDVFILGGTVSLVLAVLVWWLPSHPENADTHKSEGDQ